MALLLEGVLRLGGSLGADHYAGAVPVSVNCIRLLVGRLTLREENNTRGHLVCDHNCVRWGVGLPPRRGGGAESRVTARAGLRLLRLARRHRGLLTEVPRLKLGHFRLMCVPRILQLALAAPSLGAFRWKRGVTLLGVRDVGA